MKLPLLISLCLLGGPLFLTPLQGRAEGLVVVDAAKSTAPASPATPWSIVGAWTCTHPDWTGTIQIAADGTFSNQDSTGHWTLTGSHDRVILVLAWDGWPAETVTMISPDEFRGRVRGQGQEGEFTMHRIPVPDAAPAPAAFETRRWQQGDAPIRLIRKEEGFCALTLVTGHFQGAGEMVRVYVADDGYWYLGGDSQQEGVAPQSQTTEEEEGNKGGRGVGEPLSMLLRRALPKPKSRATRPQPIF